MIMHKNTFIIISFVALTAAGTSFAQSDPPTSPAPSAPSAAPTEIPAPPPNPPETTAPPSSASAPAPPPPATDAELKSGGPPVDEPVGQNLKGLPTNWVVPTSFRNLNGHDFLLTEFHSSPFATTHFGTITGLGGASFKTPDHNLTLVGLSQAFNLQIGFIDLITARAGIAGSALLGISPEAALFYGAGAGYDISLGAGVGKTFAGKIRIALALDYTFRKSYNFSVISAIQKSLDAGTIDSSTLLVSSSTHAPKLGVHFAWGIDKIIGILARVEYERTIQNTDGEDQAANTIGVGATLSADFNPSTPIPLGALLSYGLRKTAGGPAPLHEVVAGIHYTGRTSLSLGPELQIVSLEIASDDPAQNAKLSQFSAIFRMRYYW